jgi:hypothetical protein
VGNEFRYRDGKLQITDLVIADENAAREGEHNQDEELEC